MRSRLALGVQRSFHKQNGVLFRRNPECVVECVMPDFLHVVPIRDDVVLDGQLLQAQQSNDAQCLSRPGLAAPQPSWWPRATL